MWPNQQYPADLVTFTEEILIEKLHFLSSVIDIIKKAFLKTSKPPPPMFSVKFASFSDQLFLGTPGDRTAVNILSLK